MQRFHPADSIPPSEETIREMAAYFKLRLDTVRNGLMKQYMESNLFINDVYLVDVQIMEGPEGWGPMTYLSIKRRDRAPVGTERFRDFQLIKNMLVGPEAEAVELYPSESRLVDSANQYHLWVRNETRFPIGFNERVVHYDNVGGAKQKPLRGR